MPESIKASRPVAYRREIRVFISSTFRDMQEEREELVKQIFPQLRRLCESRGVTWGEVGLRWGVPDEAKAEGKVLPLCLAEIEHCRPYFIGLLGERYGWVPEEIPRELLETQPWLKEHRKQSVTALARGTGQRVCIVDLDLAFGDVAVSVQLDPARTVVDALPMTGHLDTTGAASLLTRYRPGLEMLLAPVTPGDAEKIPPALVGELLAVLRGMFDYVVVDTPAQFSEHVLTAMDASAHLVLLTTPDVPAVKNLRVALDMMDLLSYPREIRSVVLNRSDSRVGLTLEDVERVVRCPIVAQVPSSRAVPISINTGNPITLASSGHPVSQAITRFAEQRLLAAPGAAVAPLSRPRRRRRSA